MAIENIRAYEVKIEGANSVKELKKVVSDFRDELVKLDNTSEDYSDVVSALITGEKKLKEVMSAGKNEVTAAKGSYNALTQEMSALKKVWKEVTNEAEREAIGKRIGEINAELKKMDASIGNFQRNVGDYEGAIKRAFMTPQQELRKLRIELAQLNPETEEYKRTFQRMAQLTHDVAEQQALLKYSSSDLGDMLGNLVGVARGVAGGFAAVNAAMGLMGEENSDVQQAMLKVQQFMGLIQGLSAVEDLTKRIEGLTEGFTGFFGQMISGNKSVAEFDTQAEAGAGAANDMAGGLDNTRGAAVGASQAIDTTSQSIIKLKEAYDGATGSEKKLLGAMLDMDIDEYAEDISIASDQTLIFQSATGKLKQTMDGETVTVETLTAAEQQLAIKNGNLLKSNLLLKDSLAQTNKWQILTRMATKAQIKENEALIVGNTLQAASWKAATVAVKGFKVALASTGIGLIIVALGELLALLGKGLGKLWDWVSGANAAKKATDDIKQATDSLNESLAKSEKSWERQEKLMNAQGKSYEELYAARKKNLEAQLAEIRANISTQEAIAKDIGARKLQKKKYDEFRETLQELYHLQTKLAGEIADLSYDKYVHGVETARKAEEERAAAAKKAAEEARRVREKEAQEAETLYKQTLDYFKDERTKLDEKYKKEKALLEKYGKDTTALTKKYEMDKTAIILKELEARYKAIREYNAREASLFDDGSLEYYQNQLQDAKDMREDFLETDAQKDENGNIYAILTSDLEALNGMYGLNMKSVTDFTQQMRLNEKAVKDAEKALANYISAQKVAKYNNESDSKAFNNERSAQKSANSFNIKESEQLWLGGLSLSDRKKMMEEQYRILEEGLNEQIDLWKRASEDPELTGEARAEAHKRWTELMAQQEDTLAQHTIDSNTMMQDSFDTVTNAMLDTAQSIADIMGSIADIMLSNAEAQRDAGDITQEQYEEEFEKAKAVQIAQATINTIAGAIGAFTQASATIPPPYGQIVGAATAAAVLAGGIAQIAQIKNTKPNSSSSSSSRFTEVVPTLPDYQPEGFTNVTGEREQTDLANALTKSPIKAYVVESEMTDAQKKANKRNDESTF